MTSHRLFFSLAVRNLHIHWLRSILAAIGIIIGVVAISSMGILGNSLVLSVSESLTDVGDSVVVTPHVSFGGFGAQGTNEGISDRQLEQIRRASGNNEVVPVYTGGDRIRIGKDILAASVYGIEPQDISTLLDLETGQFLRGASGVMVGSKLAKDNNLAVGSRILIGREESGVRVVGILKERGMGFDISPDNAIFASQQWYETFYNVSEYDQVIVKVKNLNEIEQVKDSIDAQLNRREDEVDVYDTKAILETILDTFGKISTFTMAIGGISLVVAGVSIFNVMMMSVMERYREIGILRSIGTKRAEVRSMFIYESLILGVSGSLIGGIMSFIGGYAAIALMLQETSYLFEISSLIQIPYGMLFGIATSILSGLYPAWKASDLRPIEALRHE
ncbi:ABC transporter permease [Methanospirillum stamsii]|uniref:ABC transporter permease n=1 Tax=Methanospirillum stamsii TaxID=1277351 RepID=A0A2V2NGT4_9EURY|nr:ABC transporter permease [Methanospirillum stamsii]PWR75598.1 ABC transporter permease [Methanospirillum stamsii]